MTIERYDHMAIPMGDVASMMAFYTRLGFDLQPYEQCGLPYCAAIAGSVRINLQLPETHASEEFVIHASTAAPGCASFCLVWNGTLETLTSFLLGLQIDILTGPVERIGAHRNGTATGHSVYIRDPDGNALEFIVYD